MGKNKLVSFRIEEEWLKALYGLAGTFGATPDDVIRQALPDVAVVRLFFQCKDYLPDLRWDEVADVGREAIRGHLRAKYMEGLEQHLARLGVSMAESSADDIEAARNGALDELRADTAHPLQCQIPRAEEDAVYLGYLYDAWKRANAGQARYTLAQVDMDGTENTPKDGPGDPQKAWAVLKDDIIV